MKTIVLEDKGQDFLEWDLDEEGLVTGCRPFQGSIWCGCRVLGKPRVGQRPRIQKANNHILKLNYKVVEVR